LGLYQLYKLVIKVSDDDMVHLVLFDLCSLIIVGPVRAQTCCVNCIGQWTSSKTE
jgi:hypothetical protein